MKKIFINTLGVALPDKGGVLPLDKKRKDVVKYTKESITNKVKA